MARSETLNLTGERRRRKGEGDRRRGGDVIGGRLRGGESAILLRGGGDGDRPLRIGGAESTFFTQNECKPKRLLDRLGT